MGITPYETTLPDQFRCEVRVLVAPSGHGLPVDVYGLCHHMVGPALHQYMEIRARVAPSVDRGQASTYNRPEMQVE